MKIPLIISDSDGRLVYKSRSVNTDGFLRIFEHVNSKATKEGLVLEGGMNYFVKEIPLGGKKYLFFMDYTKLGERVKGSLKSVACDLFDLEKIAEEKRDISLSALVTLFSETYISELSQNGIGVILHGLAENAVVHVSPRAFVLALSLLARLTASCGRIVRFSFANECGRITVFADGEGSECVSLPEREFLEFMLYEVAAAAGFAVEKMGDKRAGYSLALSPLDIALLGLKACKDRRTKAICSCYANFFEP